MSLYDHLTEFVKWSYNCLMPRAFNELEQADIEERLRQAGRQLFAAQGVAKTSVENLAKAAGIAKGSFYKFYKNKELLFFELLEEIQNEIRAPMLQVPGVLTTRSKDEFEEVVRGVFDALDNDPFIRLMGKERELRTIMRRVPPNRLQEHQRDDQAFIDELIESWNTKAQPPTKEQVAACLTVLVLLSLQKEFIGPRLLPYALENAVNNFSACLFDDVRSGKDVGG